MNPREAVEAVLDDIGPSVVACSGGIDSLTLATVAHRRDPDRTVVAHTVTPAVPSAGTARVLAHARREGWNLRTVTSGEFDDETYLSNPVDRCYHCKTHLYDAVGALRNEVGTATILSGANVDDLGEYRPGLIAAAEHDVRHPWVEAGIAKDGIRSVARELGLPEAELPASPCLASRLYTGTRVTPERLRAVELGEAVLAEAGLDVARCRIRGDRARVEVPDDVRSLVGVELLAAVGTAMRLSLPGLPDPTLDPEPYRPGRAVLRVV